MTAGYEALRGSVALADAAHVQVSRVSGPGAYELLDRACGRDLFLQDGRLLPTLALREDGTPLADVQVGADDDAFVVVAEGPAEALREHLVSCRPPGCATVIDDLREDAEMLSVAGPYAWELLAEVIGPEIVGLPYLTFMRTAGLTCFRSGKTGEYGYDLLGPRPLLAELRDRLLETGRTFDLAEASLEDLDQAALENRFFNVRREGTAGLTPLELQLQWRLSRRKDYVGAAALAARRLEGLRERVATAIGPDRAAVGETVRHEGRTVGRILNAGRCAPAGVWVALCVLELDLAVPGIELGRAAGAPLVTTSPPLLANRSLFVNPQRHAYATRHEDAFPPPWAPRP